MLDKPRVFKKPTTVNVEIKLHHPWVILVRICAISLPHPSKVKNVRIHKIDQNTIFITWRDAYINYKRCIQTYEIYYKQNIDDDNEQWRSITQNKHIPFLSYYYHVSVPNQRLQGIIIVIISVRFSQKSQFNNSMIYLLYLLGYYKIRGMDMFGRFGEFSNHHQFS